MFASKSVLVAFIGLSLVAVAAGDLDAFLGKKYVLYASENFDGYMKALGE
jgi:hypothetical protein